MSWSSGCATRSAINAGDHITQFEITTAAALLAFAEHPADALILEVGLGGRLDATNVVARPALSVITPIAIDHADKLGDTLAKIAWEKAGILKPGVPAVISGASRRGARGHHPRTPGARLGARCSSGASDYEAFEQRGRLVYQSAERLLDLPLPALIGRHQIANAGTAIAAALRLKPLGLAIAEAIERGLTRGALAGAHAASQQRPAGAAAHAGLGAVARRRPQPGRRPGHRPDARRHGGAVAQAGRPRARHDGQQGRGGLPCALRGLVRRIVTVPIPERPRPRMIRATLATVAEAAGFTAAPAPTWRAPSAVYRRPKAGRCAS